MTTRLMRSMRRISIAVLGLLLVAGASTQLSASAFAADMPPTAKINVTPAKYKGDDNLIEFVGTKMTTTGLSLKLWVKTIAILASRPASRFVTRL